ncbi:hypothetical protein ABWH97_07960 [Nitratireductor sp. ac15]
MTQWPGNKSWFESLRRDAKLFAAVGIISLLMGLLQPLALAATAPVSHGFVICTTYGIGTASDDSREHPRASQCPLCVSGHACGYQFSSASPQIPVLALPIWHGSDAIAPCWGNRVSTTPASATAHAIRAPPALV